MDMIVHQNEGVNGNVVFEAGFIHATLDDMKRNMWQDQACATGHGMKPNQ
ncbi:hypothetical protein SQW19_16760 [Stenotrophomonas acidaminiphila]|nr:hypothetical protein [Stenotrophomonas acidaminiphila]WPU57805.1 hypothetical protein SQW19_16760 [Stenotrophomonas acidaminiphila]